MKKLLIRVNHSKELKLANNIGFILGIDNYSIGFLKTFSIKEVKSLLEKNTNREIFVSLNRPIYNSELDDYKRILKELDKLDLAGIIVGDIAALTYNLNTRLIVDQLHLNNAYPSINHYEKSGASGAYLTNDITYEEINEIRKNTKCLLFKEVFGYPHLSTSVRKFVTNYKEYFSINSKSKYYFIKEKKSDHKYIICEDYFGSHIYDSYLLQLFDYRDKMTCDYFVINSYLVDEKIVGKVINAYMNDDPNEISNMGDDIICSTGFIDKKTMYRVKHYEK